MIPNNIKRISGESRVYVPEGFHPVRATKSEVLDPWDYIHKIAYISNLVWGYAEYFGYDTPWHEREPLIYPTQYRSLRRFFLYMEKIDVDFEAFCALSFPLHYYADFTSVNKLLGNEKNHWKWMKVLRNYAGSRDAVNKVSNFLWEFFKLQIEHFHKIEIYKKNVVQSNPADGYKTKHYALYHSLHDRINNIEYYGINVNKWLKQKFKNTITIYPDTSMIHLKTIINKNGLDPDISELQGFVNDPWHPIREFLGLSDKCQFPDGCIPKGWMPGSGDYDDPNKIVSITKDGFYFYPDGTQKRGIRHHLQNSYLAIRCMPENFEQFRDSWKDYSYVKKYPTWEEYLNYALHPGYWDSEGNPTQGRLKSVKWRKRP